MNPKIPRGARTLRTYAEMTSYLRDFAAGRYSFVWLMGRPGVGKTEGIRAAVKGSKACYRKGGMLTPLQFFRDCYHALCRPVILDDGEHLLLDPVGRKLVASLGDTAPAKLLCWASTSTALGDVPRSFWTTSPLCVVANTATADEAILSRALVLYFNPTSVEVHRATAKWFWDQPIHNFFGENLSSLLPLESRWYITAHRDKMAGRDWERIALDSYSINPAAAAVQAVERDPTLTSREARAERFQELMQGQKGGASRAAYFRIRKRLEQQGRLNLPAEPPIRLTLNKPPTVPTEAELRAMNDSPPVEEPEPQAEAAEAIDVPTPTREAFTAPIRGQAAPQQPPRGNDRLPWEAAEDTEEDDDDGGGAT
jgi:hypothetical protein